MAWGREKAKLFVRQLRKSLGEGAWEWMTPAMREAVVSERAFTIVRGQDLEFVRVDAMDELWRLMMVEAGLREEESKS